MNPKNRVKVKVCGTDYAILTSESEEYLLELAYEVDSDMKKLMEQSSRMTATSAAVLCALDYLDKQRKEAETSDNMRLQINEYIQETAKTRIELDEARRTIEYLQRELASYKAKQKW